MQGVKTLDFPNFVWWPSPRRDDSRLLAVSPASRSPWVNRSLPGHLGKGLWELCPAVGNGDRSAAPAPTRPNTLVCPARLFNLAQYRRQTRKRRRRAYRTVKDSSLLRYRFRTSWLRKKENLPAPVSTDAQAIIDRVARSSVMVQRAERAIAKANPPHEKGWIPNPTLLVDTAKFGNIMPAMRESPMSHAVIWRLDTQLRPASPAPNRQLAGGTALGRCSKSQVLRWRSPWPTAVTAARLLRSWLPLPRYGYLGAGRDTGIAVAAM